MHRTLSVFLGILALSAAVAIFVGWDQDPTFGRVFEGAAFLFFMGTFVPSCFLLFLALRPPQQRPITWLGRVVLRALAGFACFVSIVLLVLGVRTFEIAGFAGLKALPFGDLGIGILGVLFITIVASLAAELGKPDKPPQPDDSD